MKEWDLIDYHVENEETPPKYYTTSIRGDAHRMLLMMKRLYGFKTMAITLDALAVQHIAQKC